MPKGIKSKRRVAELAASLRRLIVDADAPTLRRLATGGIGVRTLDDGSTSVCLTRGSVLNPNFETDRVETYLETPLHLLPLGDEFMDYSLEGCQEWLEYQGIVGCNITELGKTHSGAAQKREVVNRLFSHPGVVFALKSELLYEMDEVVEEYAVILACGTELRSYKVQEDLHQSVA